MNSNRIPATMQLDNADKSPTLLFLCPNPQVTWPGMFKNMVFGPHELVDINTNTQFLNLYETFKQLIKAPEASFIWENGKIALFQYQFRQLWPAQPWDDLQNFILHDDALRLGIVSFTSCNNQMSELHAVENGVYQRVPPANPSKARRLRAEAAPFIPQGAASRRMEGLPPSNSTFKTTPSAPDPQQPMFSMNVEIRKEQFFVLADCPRVRPEPRRSVSFGLKKPEKFFWEVDDSGRLQLIFKPLHPIGHERALKLGRRT